MEPMPIRHRAWAVPVADPPALPVRTAAAPPLEAELRSRLVERAGPARRPEPPAVSVWAGKGRLSAGATAAAGAAAATTAEAEAEAAPPAPPPPEEQAAADQAGCRRPGPVFATTKASASTRGRSR